MIIRGVAARGSRGVSLFPEYLEVCLSVPLLFGTRVTVVLVSDYMKSLEITCVLDSPSLSGLYQVSPLSVVSIKCPLSLRSLSSVPMTLLSYLLPGTTLSSTCFLPQFDYQTPCLSLHQVPWGLRRQRNKEAVGSLSALPGWDL